ncbi:MAG: hypothetical protein H7Y12_01395 [Sphingobacteriaceae bacterium]|nr:hypothetical protein [Cytophagaceae bacterium]
MSLARCCFFLLLVPVVFLPGCSHRLGAGLYGNDLTYLAKPIYRGDTAGCSAIYLSASGNLGRGFTWASRDANASGLLSLHRAHTLAHGNVAYGGFLFAGTYRLDGYGFSVYDSLLRRNTYPFQGACGYYGGGLRGSANLSIPFRRVDWRAIGFGCGLQPRKRGVF